MIGSLVLPEKEEIGNYPLQFGARNVHENRLLPYFFRSDQFGAFFDVSVRVHDTDNPYQLKEVAHCARQLRQWRVCR